MRVFVAFLLVVVLAAVAFVLLPGRALAATTSPCPNGRDGAGWTLATTTYDTAYTSHPYVGNGYLSQRVPPGGMGYMATGEKTGWPLYTPRYDGAFVAGLYGADPAIQEGRTIASAIPTWSTLALTAGSEIYSPATPAGRISNFRQALHQACGLLRTSLTWTTSEGKATDLTYDVLADRVDRRVGAVHMTMVPHWSGRATVTDRIDGAGARRLVQTGGGAVAGSPGSMRVDFATQTLGTAGSVASTMTVPSSVQPSPRAISSAQNLTATDAVTFSARAGTSYVFDKFVGVDTALTSPDPKASALSASKAAAAKGWAQLFSGHASAWAKLWESDITVASQPELQDWIRGNLYALWSSIRAGSDTSISPVGLSSDNYAGLIFWDAETWMYPSLLAMQPDVAESVIEYRNKTITEARDNATELGYQGIFYPWNGAGTGDLTQECHSVNPPHCQTQVHLQGDIALATWQYYLATGDAEWLDSHWRIIEGIAKFWESKATLNGDGSYSIKNVAGPDEYSNGVNDGVFTNGGAATALRNATKAAQVLGRPAPAEWTAIASGLRMPFDAANQVFLQYAGYQGSVIKQADTVLLIYPLEWPMTQQVAANTLDYYAERTDPDGPAMTDAMHAVDSAQIGEPGCATNTYLNRSIKPFIRDPFAQFAEARGDKAGANDPLAGSPAYDFLTGSGGFSQVFTFGLTGMRWRADRVYLDPMLPPQLSAGVTLKALHWQGRTFDVAIGASTTKVTLRGGSPFTVESPAGTQTVSSSLTIPTRRPDLTATDNLARCRTATASSEEPGMYAEAAVDGSSATIWVPADASASLTVDLGSTAQISHVKVSWTDTKPASSSIETSADGSMWTPAAVDAGGKLAKPVRVRYVRVKMTRASGAARTGIRELIVTK